MSTPLYYYLPIAVPPSPPSVATLGVGVAARVRVGVVAHGRAAAVDGVVHDINAVVTREACRRHWGINRPNHNFF